MRLAIVGSTQFAEDDFASGVALKYIRKMLKHYKPDVVISGGAAGIDTIAAKEARRLKIEVIEHLPKNPRWAPDGYKARNLLIAEDCTHLVAIKHPQSTTNGSGWTADQAMRLGKEVRKIVLGTDPF